MLANEPVDSGHFGLFDTRVHAKKLTDNLMLLCHFFFSSVDPEKNERKILRLAALALALALMLTLTVCFVYFSCFMVMHSGTFKTQRNFTFCCWFLLRLHPKDGAGFFSSRNSSVTVVVNVKVISVPKFQILVWTGTGGREAGGMCLRR